MVTPNPSDDPPYEVHYPRRVLDQIGAILEAALVRGRSEEYVECLTNIDAHLSRDPAVYGEPTRRFRRLQLLMRRGGEGPIVFIFGVHETEAKVFVSRVVPLSGPGVWRGRGGRKRSSDHKI